MVEKLDFSIEADPETGGLRAIRKSGSFRSLRVELLNHMLGFLAKYVEGTTQIEATFRVISNAPLPKMPEAPRQQSRRTRAPAKKSKTIIYKPLSGSAISSFSFAGESLTSLTWNSCWQEAVRIFVKKEKLTKGAAAITRLKELRAPGIRPVGYGVDGLAKNDKYIKEHGLYMYTVSTPQVLRGLNLLCNALEVEAELAAYRGKNEIIQKFPVKAR